MRRYLLSRITFALLTLLVVSALAFSMIYVGGGDPASNICGQECPDETLAQIRHDYGLDRPLVAQYLTWAGAAVRGDFGTSLFTKEPVTAQLAEKAPPTIEIGLLGLAIGLAIAVPGGVIAAVKHGTSADYVFRSVSIALSAIPHFWLGLVLVGLGAHYQVWTPRIDYLPLWESPIGNLEMMLPPAVLLGLYLTGVMLRMMRTEMLEVWQQDYIRTATSKGLSVHCVIVRHALRNAMIPAVTLIGSQVPLIIGGTVIIESVFGVPGVGRYLVDGVLHGDVPVVQSIVVVLSLAVVSTNLGIDLLYPVIDPRVKLS